MAFCHECGSEVAENDAFCPYCGISVKPIDVAGDQADDAFASTIMMPAPDALKLNDAIEQKIGALADSSLDSAEPENAAAAESDKKLETEAESTETASVSATAVSESVHSETAVDFDKQIPEIDEIPTPAFLQQIEQSADLVIDPPISQETGGTEATPASTGKADESFDAGSIKVAVGEFSLAQSYEEPVVSSTVEENSGTDIVVPDIEESFETASESELGARPEPDYQNIDSDLGEAVDISSSGSVLLPTSSDSAEELKPVEEVSVPENVNEVSTPLVVSRDQMGARIEPPIAMPEEELEDIDNLSPMFDSVRIIDNRSSDTNPPEGIPSSLGMPEENAVSTEDQLASSGEVRSQTAPNIGLVDTDGRKTAKLKPLEEGTVLNGRYEIVRKIGGGGMGAVYLASDNNLGGVLRAVKEMVQSYIEEVQQEKAIEDFKRESMILSSLDHPSIPTIYDYFFDERESRFYLVMKYISGGDLAARLRSAPEGRIDEMTVTEWAIQISDVLDYLHSQPSTIVYRDLKPSNIMIDGNSGRVVLIDFGIARSIGQIEEKGVTAVGTMGYAPPELFSGNVEPRSDIYSLGSTMFHLLTGADPQSNPLLIFDFQKNPRPRQINPQLSDQMERFLMRAVEYNADSRFASSAEMRQHLNEHLENLKRGTVTYGVKEIPASISLANQTVFCGFCGQKIVATDLFCAFCGAKQPIAQQGVHSEIYSHAPLTARLVIVGTSDLEAPIFSLEKEETLIGRRDPMSNIFPEVDLSRYDPQTKISRRHARIWREGAKYLVEDLGSSNGTLLFPAVSDTVRLAPRQPHALASGDKIKVGDTTLHFVVG